MNSSKIIKAYGLFAAVFCLAVTLIAVFNIVLPINGVFITPPYNDEKFFLYKILSSILILLTFTPQPIALASFYFSGGIGKSWFSHVLFVLLLGSFAALLLMFLGVIFVYFTGSSQDRNVNSLLFRYFAVVMLIFGFLHFFFFPFAFSITALVVQKISLWKRFLPIISLSLTIVITFLLGAIIYAIGVTTRIEAIYQGTRGATIPNWFMLGMIAWALTALPAFLKDETEVKP